MKIARGCKPLTHLIFSDDSILFCRTKKVEWLHIQDLLLIYERVWRNFLNKHKTSLFFSSNTGIEIKADILAIVGVSSSYSQATYLGLPSMVGKSKYQSFKNLKDKIWSKINNWKNDFLSKVGKEVISKVVVQVILTYTISVFLLLKRLCKNIASIISCFWWTSHNAGREISWRK